MAEEKLNTNDVVSSLEKNIIKQLEYYFSDSNLYRDKFLQSLITKNDGWVEIDTLLTFKRLAALSTDPKVIVDAIEKSDEGLIEISEDRAKIRRHPERPLPEQNEEVRKEIISRTAYCKGFPLTATMNDLIEFFNKYDKVTNIVMRKYLDKATKEYKFKGSVFATFLKKEQCEAFLTEKDVEYKEALLIRKWQLDYIEDKKLERDAKSKKKQKDQNIADENIELPKNATVHFSDVDPETTREIIRDTLNGLIGELHISFIDFDKGLTEGYIRFSTENAAQEFLDKITNNKVMIKEKEISFRVLKDDEEEEYLKEQVKNIKLRREMQNQKSKNQKFGYKGKLRNNRKRKAVENDDDDAPKAKK